MLGEKIRNYRSWGGYRIETLAKMLGITRQTLTKWEQGITIPDVISMKKISDILGVPMEKFIEGIDETELEIAGKSKPEKALEKKRSEKPSFGPEERYFFGVVTVKSDGKVEIPQRAMKKLGIEPGEKLLMLGDLERGIELIYEDILWEGRRNKMMEAEVGMVDDESEKDYDAI